MNFMSTRLVKISSSFLPFAFLLLVLVNTVNAQTMSNSQFKIKMGNLNTAAGLGSNSQFKLNETVGQTAANLFTGTNYRVKAGFQYIKTGNIPFSFSLSTNTIDFGVITPTNPISRTLNLTVSAGSTKGFTVIESENRPLTSTGSAIPDTTCDNGDCSPTKAGLWNASLTYGFGYRCDDTSGINCVTGFSSLFFKPFAPNSSPQSVMTSATGGTSRKSQITYKVNVSGLQTPGTYSNIVTYIASPGF